MYKQIISSVTLFLILFISIKGFSQIETFDIISYTPPRDWKKDAKNGVVNYTNVNTTAGTFCVITIYASSPGTGDAQKDFSNEWKELAVIPYNAEPNPQTEIQTTADGWQYAVGAAPIKLDGADVYIILTVFSGFGKKVSIRTSLNDQSFTPQIDALLESMKLDKTTTFSANNNTPPTVPTNAGPGKFGLMIYSAPLGWSEQKFQDGIVFKPLDIPAGEHLAIQIMQPLNASGTLEQALAQSFEEATIMYKGTSMYQADGKYGKIESKRSFNGWEYIRGKGGIRVNDGSELGTEMGLEVFVIKINNRFERIAILESRKYCNGGSRYYTSDRRNYRDGIEKLLYSLRFSDFSAPGLEKGSIKGPGIIGIWEGLSQSTSTPGFKIDVYLAIFLTNGQVYFGSKFPVEGMDGLDTRIPAELYRRDWKTYTFGNGKGVLNMIFADIPFRIEGNKLVVTKNQMDWHYYKLKPVDGARFDGTYVMAEAYGKIPSITFTLDGRFTDHGAIKVLYHEYVDCLNPALSPGSGTYEVKEHTIHFNYTDGRKIRVAFLGTGYDRNNPSAPALRMSFNEDPMTRQ